MIAPGTRVGPYEISSPIGAGGMGEVYRATDTNLKRQVALQVLPEALAADGERLARFQREAEVLASLNHPNIAILHGLEKSDGITALVMELDVVKEAIDAGEFRADISPSFARDLIFGCIEHRTWAFLRSEGDFDVEETANKLTDIVCRGLASDQGVAKSSQRDAMPDVMARLESLVERLEKQVK